MSADPVHKLLSVAPGYHSHLTVFQLHCQICSTPVLPIATHMQMLCVWGGGGVQRGGSVRGGGVRKGACGCLFIVHYCLLCTHTHTHSQTHTHKQTHSHTLYTHTIGAIDNTLVCLLYCFTVRVCVYGVWVCGYGVHMGVQMGVRRASVHTFTPPHSHLTTLYTPTLTLHNPTLTSPPHAHPYISLSVSNPCTVRFNRGSAALRRLPSVVPA